MKARLECLACVAAQALRAARIVTDDPVLQRRILNEVISRIPAMDLDKTPAELSMPAYEVASQLSGNPDPYREIRRKQNELALRLEPELRAMVKESSDPVKCALHLAAAGNVIDMGIMDAGDIDVRDAIEQVMKESFVVNHTEEFRRALARANTLLLFLDNAGEIVFDKVLIEELLKHVQVTAVVKGAPIINDAIMEDAEQVGLTSICEVIHNDDALIGSPLDRIPDTLRERVDRADMILAKGQGNYETIDEYPGDVFLLLRAKCEVIAQDMGVKLGQVGLIFSQLC